MQLEEGVFSNQPLSRGRRFWQTMGTQPGPVRARSRPRVRTIGPILPRVDRPNALSGGVAVIWLFARSALPYGIRHQWVVGPRGRGCAVRCLKTHWLGWILLRDTRSVEVATRAIFSRGIAKVTCDYPQSPVANRRAHGCRFSGLKQRGGAILWETVRKSPEAREQWLFLRQPVIQSMP